MDFYLTIHSEVSNSLSRTTFKKALFVENYEVALTEINFESMNNIIGYVNLYQVDNNKKIFLKRFSVNAIEYELYIKIIERIDKDIEIYFKTKSSKSSFIIDKSQYENFEIDVTDPKILKFSNNFSKKIYVLNLFGSKLIEIFGTKELVTDKQYIIKDVYTSKLQLHDLYMLKANIVEFQQFNTDFFQFLRIINTTENHQEFKFRNYLSINKTEIYSLTFEFCDLKGEKLPTKPFKFTAILHFRKKHELLCHSTQQ